MASGVQDPLPGGRDPQHPCGLCAGAECLRYAALLCLQLPPGRYQRTWSDTATKG